jgi:hypothetical protein
MYQGGYFRVDATIAAQADVALHLEVAEPTTVAGRGGHSRRGRRRLDNPRPGSS